jgi:DNA-binding transcriptional MerR regulator
VKDNDELLTIGRFASLTGLSAHALRHYDDVALLNPAVVDEQSRYRRYRRDQAGQARLISALRWMDLPIEEIRRSRPRTWCTGGPGLTGP